MIRQVLAVGVTAAWVVSSAPVVTGLQAQYRSGQTFLTWQEAAVPADTTFTVYHSKAPIHDAASLAGAAAVCSGIEPHSAEDWTRDPGLYGKGRVADRATGEIPPAPAPVGFIIEPGGARLDPASGLHVHTVLPSTEGEAYYAVTVVRGGVEDRTVVAGENALRRPVRQHCEPIEPIWQDGGAGVPLGAGAGRPLLVSLHAKGNRAACKYVVFGDATHAWREGIPFMFDVSVRDDHVVLSPSNTMYIGRSFGRPIGEQRQVRGIWTFWYGCSDAMPDAGAIAGGTPTNYSERRLLYEIAWVKRHLGTDPARTYCSGSSMGGCGTISFAYRHPEIFAAVSAHVPIVAYNQGDPAKGADLGWHDNTFRLTGFCGPMTAICSDGVPLSERLNATALVQSYPGELPFLIVTHGRQDRSIPWHNNPPFYRALAATRRGCLVAWNNGAHPEVERLLPDDVREWKRTGLLRFALDRSYPAFSNCSRNDNPGGGDNTDGDIVGYFNRGLNWSDPQEDERRYEVLITYDLEAADLPLSVDVTPRRCQVFRAQPGARIGAANIDSSGTTIQSLVLEADASGTVTFPAFQVTAKNGNRLQFSW